MTRRIGILLFDILVSEILLFILLFGFNPGLSIIQVWSNFLSILWYSFPSSLTAQILFKPHQHIIRNTAVVDLVQLFKARITATLICLLLGNLFSKPWIFNFNVIIIIQFFIVLTILSCSRILVKSYFTFNERRIKGSKQRILIFGTGELGKLVYLSLEKSVDIVAFVDEDVTKIGKYLFGKRIYPFVDLHDLIEKMQVEVLVVGISHLPEQKKKQVLESSLVGGYKVRYAPSIENLMGKSSITLNKLTEFNIEDLLGRPVIKADELTVRDRIFGKVILVSGAAGSIGSEICRQLLPFWPSKLICLDQAETPMFELGNELNSLKLYQTIPKYFEICDITDPISLEEVFKKYTVDLVFHAAAYKHVPLMENMPIQALKTNCWGTSLIANLSVKYGVERFVQISTDKAVNPTNIMGASKRAAEIYTHSLQGNVSTKFITTRFGNVLGSNGSVIPIFNAQIKQGGPVLVTHPDIERYFMTIPEACNLVLQAGAKGEGGEIYIFDMGSPVRILDLAEKMILLSGLKPYQDIDIKFTGLRPGEKLFEELLTKKENVKATVNSQLFIAKVVQPEREFVEQQWLELEEIINQSQDLSALMEWIKRMVPEYHTQQNHLDEMGEYNKYEVKEQPITISPYLLSKKKRMFDVFLVLLALPIGFIILLMLYIPHQLIAGRPFFYYHDRIGLNSFVFKLFKVRTLRHGHNNLRSGSNPTDISILPIVGSFLRNYKIDELPQIWNILIGQMSWVGPRPEQSILVEEYIAKNPKFETRHLAKPGITGLAQVHNPTALADDFNEKLYFDLQYIEKASLWLDLSILLRSFRVVVFGK
jgi:FlaA1/EpsC-like NDP-sugar epimerase/lipopolysaccharide/colanic/teichoic acid biosynthesis glycosyltransferase